MFQSGFLDKKSTLDTVKEAASLPSTGADTKSAKKKLQEAFAHQPDVKLDSLVSRLTVEDASQADVSRMLGMPPPPSHGEDFEAGTDLVVRPSTRLQSRGQAGQSMHKITSALQDKPPAGQASETGIVAGVPQAQPPTETVEQRATNEPASLASFSQSRQRRQCWKPLQAGGPAPDTADSDWGALAAEHGDRLMQLAQEAPSSLTGPEPASAGLESQIDTADSSRRHEIKLQASRINDSDSDEYADPEGSLLAGLPRAMRGLPGQLHASKPALRRKLRSTSRQQAQCDLTNSDSDEVREIPPITEYELRFTHREENPSSSFDSAASNVDDGADPSAPSSVTEDSMDRFLHGCRPPSLPSVPSSPRDSEELSTAVSAFQLAETPLQSESDEEVDRNGERIVHLDPWGRTVKKDAFGWWKRKHGSRLVTVPVSLQRQKVQELRHGKPRPPPATPDEVEVEKLRRLGNKLNRQGKHKEALGAYLQAHWLQPKDIRLLAGLAAIYVHLGKWNAAEKSANQAEEIDPDELNLYWWRHLARIEQGNLQPALEDLTQILFRHRNYQQRGHFYSAFERYKVLRKEVIQQLKGRNNALDQTPGFTIINTSGSTAHEAEYAEKLLALERSLGRKGSRPTTAALVEEVLRNDERLQHCRRREKEAARLRRGDPDFAKGIEPLERELREAERKSPAFLKRHQQAQRNLGGADWDPLNSLGVATTEDSIEEDIDRFINALDHKGSSGLL